VTIVGPFGEKTGYGYDAFEALTKVRQQIEPDGWRVGLAGALPNVWPSGMARDMGSGLKAYVLVSGVRPKPEDLVDVFSAVSPAKAVDVATQLHHVHEILGI
jgi:hypothetical protein